MRLLMRMRRSLLSAAASETQSRDADASHELAAARTLPRMRCRVSCAAAIRCRLLLRLGTLSAAWRSTAGAVTGVCTCLLACRHSSSTCCSLCTRQASPLTSVPTSDEANALTWWWWWWWWCVQPLSASQVHSHHDVGVVACVAQAARAGGGAGCGPCRSMLLHQAPRRDLLSMASVGACRQQLAPPLRAVLGASISGNSCVRGAHLCQMPSGCREKQSQITLQIA
jgi:hypothetical protein